jgi:hypothetical protein
MPQWALWIVILPTTIKFVPGPKILMTLTMRFFQYVLNKSKCYFCVVKLWAYQFYHWSEPSWADMTCKESKSFLSGYSSIWCIIYIDNGGFRQTHSLLQKLNTLAWVDQKLSTHNQNLWKNFYYQDISIIMIIRFLLFCKKKYIFITYSPNSTFKTARLFVKITSKPSTLHKYTHNSACTHKSSSKNQSVSSNQI